MKLNKLFLWTAIVFVAVVACGCSAQRSAASGGKVPFKVAHNYFVNNNAPNPVPTVVDSKESFERFFGMAAFMGRGGQPTPIDFQKEFVLAVVPPESSYSVDITPLRLRQKGDSLLFTYYEKVGTEKRSFIIQPLLLIVVDRKYYSPNVVLIKK